MFIGMIIAYFFTRRNLKNCPVDKVHFSMYNRNDNRIGVVRKGTGRDVIYDKEIRSSI